MTVTEGRLRLTFLAYNNFIPEGMATLVLSNINLQVEPGILTPQSKKILKVQSVVQKPTLFKLKEPAEVLGEQSLQWHETLTLPAKFGTAFPFEGFGYNPEEIDSVMEGKIVVKKTDKDYCGWQVFLGGKKVGFLFANIEARIKSGAKQSPAKVADNNSSFFGSTIELTDNSIAFLSLYANFPPLGAMDKRRVYLEFEVGSVIARSAIRKLQQSQYRSHQLIQVKHHNPKVDKLTVLAFTFDSHLNKIQLLGKGSTHLTLPLEDDPNLSLDERVKLQRVFIYHENDEVGWVSFKYLKAKEESLDPRYFLQDKFATVGDTNFRPLKNASVTIADAGRSRISMSPLEANSRIFIPKSERFQNPAKRKACERIGIAHQSMELRDFPASHRYRVPSLGFGHKISPVQRDRDVPGAGRYQLPTLFDCFRR